MSSEAAYETLMQFLYQAPIGLVQTTLAGSVEMINPMAASLLMPLSRDSGLDNLFALLHGVAPQLRQLVAAHDAPSGEVCRAVRVALPAPRRGAVPQVLSIGLLKLDAARLMAVLNDVTLDAQREQQGLARGLSDAARVDALTRLPNRAALRERIQHLLDRRTAAPTREFAVLFLNCDRFKQINDTLGPAAGDKLLRLIAERVGSALRQRERQQEDASAEPPMAARIGGDEFVVVVDDLRDADHALVVAHRLQDVLAQPFGVAGQQVHSGVRIGIVLQAQASGDADSVLQDASIAVAEAKRGGAARCVVFEPEMRQRAARRAGIEAELRIAVAEQQLFVVYQPVVGLLAGGGVDHGASVEALVRWRHPLRGVVPPVEFIGVAEECGLIGALGDFVLSVACRDFVQWQATLGVLAPRLLAVNLSRAQLAQPGWVASVGAVLSASGIAPAQLQLEVTESLAAQDEAVQCRLHELKALGIQIALDDFGTGYSSLASLHLLPVDTVKIDRSFVSRADTSAHHRVLIDATVRVAHSLQMNTVAEGIETSAQAAVVRELGCDKGQGYLYSRPLPAPELAAWLLARCAGGRGPLTHAARQTAPSS